MAGLLAHCLAAIVFQAFLGKLFGYNFISNGIFIAGLIAMLIDIDHIDLPPYRTPYTHSVLFSFVWIYAIWFIALILNFQVFEMTLSAISAFFTHLVIDANTKGGIYIYPHTKDYRQWFVPLPMTNEIEKLRFGVYAVKLNWLKIGAIREGDMAWKFWRRYPEKLKARKQRESSSARYNVSISLVSLCLLALLVAFG
ncbi:MAG: metal-dependent hydrolase [Candidatus Thermoplasmatota archaeon]